MADQFTMPDDLKGKSAEDIAQLYVNTRSEYDKYKGEWEPRSKDLEAYRTYGSPDEIKTVVEWGKSIAPLFQQISKGEVQVLNSADFNAYKNWAEKTKNGTAQPSHDRTPAPDEDLFAPVEKRLEEKLIAAANKLINDRAQQDTAALRQWQRGQQDQLNLFAYVNKLQKQYPNLDFESILQKGADYAQAPADQLLNKLIETEVKMSGMDAEIDKRVAAKIAETQATAENDRVKVLLGNRPAGASNFGNGPAKRSDTTKALVDTLGKKYPGIYDHIPLA